MMARDARLDVFDRLDEIGSCIAAVSDLMSPGLELQDRQRDHIAILMEFLQQEYRVACEEARRACLDTESRAA